MNNQKSTNASRYRGALRNAALWGVGFGSIGLVLALVAAAGPSTDELPRSALVLSLAFRFAVFGVICGAVFGWVTGLLFQPGSLARFGRVPVALFGASGTAVFVPLFMQTMNVLSGDGVVPWSLVLDDAVWAFFFGGAAALGSLELARRRVAASDRG